MVAREKYKQLAEELYSNPFCEGIREINPAPSFQGRMWYFWNIYLFPYSSLVKDDRDSLDPNYKPSMMAKVVGTVLGAAQGESSLGLINSAVFVSIFVAIGFGIFAATATGKTKTCSSGLVQYCVAPICQAPVCPSLAAPAPAPAAILG